MLMELGRGMATAKSNRAAGSAYLDGVIASACCDLDATIADSYGGSGQTWANLIASPADGAAQTDYDFYRGGDNTANTDDPAFFGTAGDQAAYWGFDGGDFFSAINYANAQTLWNAHRTDVSGTWIAVAWEQGDTIPNWQGLFGTGVWNTGDRGITFFVRTTGDLEVWQSNGVTKVIQSVVSGTPIAINSTYIAVLSWDGTATTNNMRSWLNSTTKHETSVTFETTTADPTESGIAIGATAEEGDAAGRMANNSKIYSFACGNEFIDDAKAAAIISHLETRHNRDYTP